MAASLLLSLMLSLLLTLLLLLLLLYTIYRPPAFLITYLQNHYPDVVFHIPTANPLIALTIDDAPSEYTASILALLNHHNIHATFFIIGSQVPGHEETLRAIVRQGHELGNHAMYDEPSYKLSDSELHSQIETVDRIVAEVHESCNKQPPSPGRKYFRPGSGFFTSRMRCLVKETGYQLVLGDIYPHDAQIVWWRVNAWHVLSQLRSGGVVICHDREWTVPMLERVVPEIKRRGFLMGSLSEVLDTVTRGQMG
jgi:peptidoglycan/xylan/chitin deacetylase (PgdA/CDA1 family)